MVRGTAGTMITKVPMGMAFRGLHPMSHYPPAQLKGDCFVPYYAAELGANNHLYYCCYCLVLCCPHQLFYLIVIKCI